MGAMVVVVVVVGALVMASFFMDKYVKVDCAGCGAPTLAKRSFPDSKLNWVKREELYCASCQSNVPGRCNICGHTRDGHTHYPAH